MYAQIDTTAPPSGSSAARPTRGILRTRPGVQRISIRSWEYSQPIRTSILFVRLLVVLWLVILSVGLMSAGHAWGWILLPAAVAVLAFSLWVFRTAAKGWPVDEA